MLFEEEFITEEKAIDYLQKMGYIIIAPSCLDETSVKACSGLVDFFYSYLQFCNQERKLHYTKASKRDLKQAKGFIERRSCEGNLSKSRAIKECVSIIKCVIENEEVFDFPEPLHSMDYFGQDNMKWVTDKAISIINKENDRIDKRDLILFSDRLYNTQEKEATSKIEKRVEELKDILGGLDGEEKR